MISPPSISAILRDHAVHELAIVRRHQQRAGPRLQERLEPDDRFDVEVVGRLVHQQDVGRAEQHARHRDAHLPAAREQSHVAVDPLVVEAEPVQHFARLRFEAVAAEVLVLLLHLAEAREDAVHVVRLDRDRPSRAAAPRARDADRPAGRCRQSPRPAPSGPTSPRRPAGSSRWSASSAPTRRLRPAISSPTIIRNSVVLPAPFGPTSPTFSPGLSWKDASTNSTCRPYCLLTRENEITRAAPRGRRAPPRRRPARGDRRAGRPSIAMWMRLARPIATPCRLTMRCSRVAVRRGRAGRGSSPADRWRCRSPDPRRCRTRARTCGCTPSRRRATGLNREQEDRQIEAAWRSRAGRNAAASLTARSTVWRSRSGTSRNGTPHVTSCTGRFASQIVGLQAERRGHGGAVVDDRTERRRRLRHPGEARSPPPFHSRSTGIGPMFRPNTNRAAPGG